MSSSQQPWDWAVKEMAWWECPLYLERSKGAGQELPIWLCWIGPPLLSEESSLGAEWLCIQSPLTSADPGRMLSLPQPGEIFNGS